MVSQGQLQSCMLSAVIWKPHETTISFLTPALHCVLEQRQLADEERKVVLFFFPTVQLLRDLHSLLSCKVAAKSVLSHEHFWRQWEWRCPAIPAPSAGFKGDVGPMVTQGLRKDFHSSFINTWRPIVRVKAWAPVGQDVGHIYLLSGQGGLETAETPSCLSFPASDKSVPCQTQGEGAVHARWPPQVCRIWNPAGVRASASAGRLCGSGHADSVCRRCL